MRLEAYDVAPCLPFRFYETPKTSQPRLGRRQNQLTLSAQRWEVRQGEVCVILFRYDVVPLICAVINQQANGTNATWLRNCHAATQPDKANDRETLS